MSSIQARCKFISTIPQLQWGVSCTETKIFCSPLFQAKLSPELYKKTSHRTLRHPVQYKADIITNFGVILSYTPFARYRFNLIQNFNEQYRLASIPLSQSSQTHNEGKRISTCIVINNDTNPFINGSRPPPPDAPALINSY